ncbi:MAG: carbohydrate ABC transporter permease [Clostridiales bacterium]|nr:carbohydrate ABC transporter permease [Clostridiales bacterium]
MVTENIIKQTSYKKNKSWLYLKTPREKVFDFILIIILATVVIITLLPIWSQLCLSLSSKEQVVRNIFLLWPKEFTLSSYKLSVGYKMLWIGYRNTIFRCLLAVPISVLVTILTAYPLSKKGLPFRKFFTSMILITMLFNGGLIPNYLLITRLKFINKIWALVLPNALMAFYVLLARNFFMGIPEALEESASIDGAKVATVFIRIILPLSIPIIATLMLFQLVFNWNAWFDSMIYMTKPDKQVLQIVLRKIVIQNNLDGMEAMMRSVDEKRSFTARQLQATIIMLSVIPMLIVYPFVQKYFVKGIMIGAVKG